MIKIFVAVVVAVASVAIAEEAPFTVVPHAPPLPFEERIYPGGLGWACSSRDVGPDADFTPAAAAFMNLYYGLLRYFGGHNTEGARIPRAYPTSLRVSDSLNGQDQVNMTLCIYLGAQHQENPPQPTDPSVDLRRTAHLDIVTRRVGGHMTNNAWLVEAFNLYLLADWNDMPTKTSAIYFNTYHAPSTFGNDDRRNEVWLERVPSNGGGSDGGRMRSLIQEIVQQ